MQPNLALADQIGLDIVAIALVAKQLGQAQPELALRLRPTREPRVEHRLRQVLAPVFIEQIGDAREVEHIIADRHSRPPLPLGFGENAERQILNRKIAVRGARDPARSRRVVGFVDHGSFALGKPVQAKS